MVVSAYVMLLVIFTDSGVIMKPTVTDGAVSCAIALAAEQAKQRPQSVAYCVPPGAALEIQPDDKPVS